MLFESRSYGFGVPAAKVSGLGSGMVCLWAVGSLAMANFLFYGDTGRSAAMRHELPIVIVDPFLLAVVDERVHVVVSGLERDRVAAAVPDTVVHDIAGLGFGELLESGMSSYQIELELAARGAAALGIGAAIADPDMPVAVADRLRSDGIVLTVDHDAVAARRRVKSAAELAGIRSAQAAAEAGMRAARPCFAGPCRMAAVWWRMVKFSPPNLSVPCCARRARRAVHQCRRRSLSPRYGRDRATSQDRARCRRPCRS